MYAFFSPTTASASFLLPGKLKREVGRPPSSHERGTDRLPPAKPVSPSGVRPPSQGRRTVPDGCRGGPEIHRNSDGEKIGEDRKMWENPPSVPSSKWVYTVYIYICVCVCVCLCMYLNINIYIYIIIINSLVWYGGKFPLMKAITMVMSL